MGLLDEIHELQTSKGARGTKCSMCVLMRDEDERLSARDKADLTAALRAEGISDSTVIQVLEARGIELTDAMVGNHRRRHLK